MEMTSTIADQLIEASAWKDPSQPAPKPAQVASDLRNYINCTEEAEMMKHWHPVEGHLFPQGTLTELAIPAIDVFLAALLDPRPSFSLAWILEALRFAAVSAFDDRGNPECRRRLRSGLWLLAAMALEQPPSVAAAAVEVIEVIDPALAALIESTDQRQ